MAPAPEPTFLNLRPREQDILYALSAGQSVEEVAADRGMTYGALMTTLSRAIQREGCRNSLHLVVRYIEEYRGMGEPWRKTADSSQSGENTRAQRR